MRKLYDLDVSEVSLVPRGANKKKFLVYKSHEGKIMNDIKTSVRQMIAGVDPKVMEKVEAVVKSMYKADAPPQPGAPVERQENEQAAGKELSPHAQAALKAVGRIMAPHKEELNQGHVKAVMKEVGLADHEASESPAKEQAEEGAMQKGVGNPEKVKEEHKIEALEKAKEAYKAHMEKLGNKMYPDAEMQQKAVAEENESSAMLKGLHDEEESDEDEEYGQGEEDIGKALVAKSEKLLKNLSPAEAKKLESIFKAQNELIKKNAELSKVVKAQEEEKKEAELVAKADSFTHLGLKKEDLLEQLKLAKAAGEKAFALVCKNFESMNNQAKNGGLFKEIGSRLPANGSGSSEAKIEALVDSIVAKTGAEKSRAQIYDEVTQTPEGKKLLAEQMNEQYGGGR